MTGEERGEECGLTGGSRRTLAAIANDGHGTNDIVVPCAAALLNSEQVIFLLIIEDIVRALVARHVLYEGCFNIPVLKPVMLLMVRFKLLSSLSLYGRLPFLQSEAPRAPIWDRQGPLLE